MIHNCCKEYLSANGHIVMQFAEFLFSHPAKHSAQRSERYASNRLRSLRRLRVLCRQSGSLTHACHASASSRAAAAPCASSIFMRSMVAMSKTQAALLRVKSNLSMIQRLWRDVAAIRREQRSVFMRQLLGFEARLLRANSRKCASLKLTRDLCCYVSIRERALACR